MTIKNADAQVWGDARWRVETGLFFNKIKL